MWRYPETVGPGGRHLTVSEGLRIPLVQRRRLAGSMDRYRYLGISPAPQPMPGVRGAHFISFIVQGSASVRKRAVEWQHQFDELGFAYPRGHRLSCSVYRSGSTPAVLQWDQLTSMDGEAASLRAENKN